MPRAKPTPETNINVSVAFHQEQSFTNIMRIFDPTPHGAVRGIFSLISLFVWTIRSCSTMATAFQRGVNLSDRMYKKSSLVTKHKKNIYLTTAGVAKRPSYPRAVSLIPFQSHLLSLSYFTLSCQALSRCLHRSSLSCPVVNVSHANSSNNNFNTLQNPF